MLPTSKLGKAILCIVTIACMYFAYKSLLAEQLANAQLATFSSDYEPGSDGYCIDSIMYQHPSWSYDKAEDYLFLDDSTFNMKYNEK